MKCQTAQEFNETISSAVCMAIELPGNPQLLQTRPLFEHMKIPQLTLAITKSHNLV